MCFRLQPAKEEKSLNWAKAIQEHGFGIIPNVLTQQDVDDLLEDVSRADLPRSRAGVRHAMKGSTATPFRATIFDKSSTANWLVVWHQDTALPLCERRETPGWGPWSVKDGVVYAHAPANALSQVLALRLHLDDSTAENGPLRVLPETHTLGLLSDEELHDLSTRVAAIDCLVPVGGVLAMRPLIVHASSKSQSKAPRRVLHIEYAAARKITDRLELAIA